MKRGSWADELYTGLAIWHATGTPPVEWLGAVAILVVLALTTWCLA